MAEAMSDERLAEIRAELKTHPCGHNVGGSRTACELLAEVDRLRAVEARMRAVINEDITAYETQLNAIHEARDYWQDETVKATTRAETAERELAEVRERLGETSVEYAALYTSWANSSHGETKAIGPFKTTDELLAAQNSELWPIGRDSWSLGSRLAGQWRPTEWKAAKQQTEDGGGS